MSFDFGEHKPRVVKVPTACVVCDGMCEVPRPPISTEKTAKIRCPACKGKGFIVLLYTPYEWGEEDTGNDQNGDQDERDPKTDRGGASP